jgi:hypothetical protein
MRVRNVNEKAVGKLISFLTELKIRIGAGAQINSASLQENHGVSKSTISACRKMEIISPNNDGTFQWNLAYDSDRKTAVKILELLRQRADKQTDKPISDLWVAEISHIKELLTQVRDNTKKNNNRSEGFKISERTYIAGQIASGCYVDTREFAYLNFDATNAFIIKATDDLLSKLNS